MAVDAQPSLRIGVVSIPYRYIALVLLLFQTTAIILTMRHTLKGANGPKYIKTTAVVMAEIFKVVASTALLKIERKCSVIDLVVHLKVELIDKWRSAILLAIPAGLYTLQNNLLFIALQNLDGTTYQITYQLKIFSAAVFSVLMLGKKLDVSQWTSLLILMIGVVTVQMPSDHSAAKTPDGGSPGLGLLAVMMACTTSGFAGVYFEKILKGTNCSVWMRNIQLGLFSVVLGLFGVYGNDYDAVISKGFLSGYDKTVWVVVTLNGIGGLVVAAVIKYADNILKSFANALSIVATGIISSFADGYFMVVGSCFDSAYIFMNDFTLTSNYLIGTVLVVAASYMYGANVKLYASRNTTTIDFGSTKESALPK